MFEVDFAKGRVVRVGDQYEVGRLHQQQSHARENNYGRMQGKVILPPPIS